MSASKALFEKRGAVGVVTLNNPDKMNALDLEMTREINRILDEIEGDGRTRAVLIKGAGRAFSSGGDVKAMHEALGGDPGRMLDDLIGAIHPIILRLRGLPLPVIAAIHGYAAGAGMNLALACDLRIAAESARFVEAFVKIGLTPDSGGTYFLARMVGLGKAAELFFKGDVIDAAEALRLGIVNRVVPDDQLERASTEMATELAAGPTAAIGRTKRLLNRSLVSDLPTQLENERISLVESGKTEDFEEGVRAFFEKRRPNFGGA